MIQIRYVEETDKVFWFHLDRHISQSTFEQKVRDKQGYVLLKNGLPKGILRFHYFWDSIPFCTMLYISEDTQGQGLGKSLMAYWETQMKAQGHGMVMTSTQVDEQAQHFYRKLGYMDAGGIIFSTPGYEQPMELILTKKL